MTFFLSESLGSTLRVEGSGSATIVRLIDKSYIKMLSLNVRNILVEREDGKMDVEEFRDEYKKQLSSFISHICHPLCIRPTKCPDSALCCLYSPPSRGRGVEI